MSHEDRKPLPDWQWGFLFLVGFLVALAAGMAAIGLLLEVLT